MKKLLALALAALAGLLAMRRVRAGREEADLWREATEQPDLR